MPNVDEETTQFKKPSYQFWPYAFLIVVGGFLFGIGYNLSVLAIGKLFY